MQTVLKVIIGFLTLLILAACTLQSESKPTKNKNKSDTIVAETKENKRKEEKKEREYVSSEEYDKMMAHMVNNDTTGRWPVEKDKYPLAGAILPFKRIVAFYGNLYSKNMGALGEYPPEELWRMIKEEMKEWQEADPETPVVPAIHYIAATAQQSAMKDKTYRMRMPHSQIDSAQSIAKMEDALLFLDLQVGHSSVMEEVKAIEKYLTMPDVHLGIDPEFSMKGGHAPGRKVGTFDADDINDVSNYLAQLVRDNKIPPKVLVVHRFTKGMVTNASNIQLHPEVQIVMNMDGWGAPQLKYDTYEHYIRREPVQFTGFKIFYKNDLKRAPHRLLTPKELIELKPRPIYIQYQ